MAWGEEKPAAQPTPQPAQTEDEPKVEEWPIRPLSARERQKEKLSSAIFDLVEKITLFDVSVGAGDLKVKTGRRVYDNHDVLKSWTVVDRFITSFSYPIVSAETGIGSGFYVGFSIDTAVSADFLNIRQVVPEEYKKLDKPGERARELENSKWSGNLQSDDSPETRALMNMEVGSLQRSQQQGDTQENVPVPFDGLSEARYSQLTNMIRFPTRIPIKPEWIDHMSVGEIISYTGQGLVELGPKIGWSLDVTAISNAIGVEFAVRAYLIGKYRISIFREDERYVQVKFTREATLGGKTTLDSGTEDWVMGFIFFDATIHHSAIAPFAFRLSRSRTRSFDVVYRYDLDDPTGRDAFKQAVSARFGMSDELSGGSRWQALPPDMPVTKMGIRDTRSERFAKASSTRLFFVYRHQHDVDLNNADIVVTVEDGTSRAFRAVAKTTQLWKWVWGDQEIVHHTYRINANIDSYEQNLPDAVSLTIEGDITDNDTSGREMNDYIDEVETAANRPGFFPRPLKYQPLVTFQRINPNEEFERRTEPRHAQDEVRDNFYGRCSFFYQITYDQNQIEKFLNLPDSETWPALEKAFGMPAGSWSTVSSRRRYKVAHIGQWLLNLPLYLINVHLSSGSNLLRAESIHEKWMAARKPMGIRDKVRALGKLFSNRLYGSELSRLVRLCLEGEQSSYLIQGSSHIFGVLRSEGSSKTIADPIPPRLEKRFDIERQGPRPRQDNKAKISGQAVEIVDGSKLKLTFTVESKVEPKAVFFRLIEHRSWMLPGSVGEKFYFNNAQLIKPGENTIIVDEKGGILENLYKTIRPNRFYELVMAYSIDGRIWGPMSAVRFRVKDFEHKEPEEKPAEVQDGGK
jgi:hypothetical protein